MPSLRRALLLILAAALAPVLSGCIASQDSGGSGTQETTGQGSLPVRAVFGCQGTEEMQVVARTSADWAQVWMLCSGLTQEDLDRGLPHSALPAIDFSRHMVVGYNWGPMPSTGFEVLISHVWGGADANIVDVVRISPGASCGVYTVVVPVGQLVVIDRVESDVSFVFRDATVTC